MQTKKTTRVEIGLLTLLAIAGCTVPTTTKQNDLGGRDHSKYDDDGKPADDDRGSSLGTPQEISCPDPCKLGEKRCAADGAASAATEVCAEVDGCPRFTQGEDCSGDTQCDRAKNDGTCAAGCKNDAGCHELSVGLEKCGSTGSRSRLVCRKEGACYKWLSQTACSPDERCEGGRCVASCTNLCTSGATRCVTGDPKVMERCAIGPNGCTSWTKSSCAASHFCTTGACGPL